VGPWLALDATPLAKQCATAGGGGSGACHLTVGVRVYPTRTQAAAWPATAVAVLYRQLRRDVAAGRLPVSDAVALELTALAARVELGPFDPVRHLADGAYLLAAGLLPAAAEAVVPAVAAAHRQLGQRVTSAADASRAYVALAQAQDRYG